MDNCNSMDMDVIKDLCASFAENNQIRPEYYTKYGVKRGLRNSDGTGVLAGLTTVSNVHGYIVDEGERRPVQGVLNYRGYNIFDLLEGFEEERRFGYEEVAYLLLCGNLPDTGELSAFRNAVGNASLLPPNFTEDILMRAPSPNIMNKLASATLALYSYDENPDDISMENVMRQSVELLARFPVIISHAYQAKRRYFDNKSMYLRNPDPEKSSAENILRLIRPDGKYSYEEAVLLDRCLILHAEHGGGNNSAFAARVVSSSSSDTYSAISAAIGSLKGPRHGGANLRVVEMFDDLKANVADITDKKQVYDYLVKLLRREANDGSGLIYGMGHAVYTLSDPRTIALKSTALPLAERTGFMEDFKLRELVEDLTPEVLWNVKGSDKVVCANVDMYSGLIYQMLNIPTELFTPLFASARIAGWLAHRQEELANSKRIIRPAYKPLYREKQYVKLLDR